MANPALLNRKTKSIIKKSKVIRETISYSGAKSIGIIFTADSKEKFDSLKRFVHNLENDNKQVDVISYVGKGKENFEFRYDFFTKKDVGFWGNFKSEIVLKFIANSYDYLYCVDIEPDPLVVHVMARSNAKCRIGVYTEIFQDHFEMMIKLKGDRTVSHLINEMQHFTKKLVSHGE